jgi:hypothetical protein
VVKLKNQQPRAATLLGRYAARGYTIYSKSLERFIRERSVRLLSLVIVSEEPQALFY